MLYLILKNIKKTQAVLKLMKEPAKSRCSETEKGWLEITDAGNELGIVND